jgi:AcrR family transcriptional regulator
MAEVATDRGRRRSARAHEAIIQATQELLVERGYRELTIEGIAARAGVGKQTIYRWWPSRSALVLEAYLAGAEPVSLPPDSGSTREDVRALVIWLADVLSLPMGQRVVAGLIADLQHDPDLADGFRRDVVPARRQAMLAALERGRDRGEIRADADLAVAVDALHGAVFYRLLLSGEPLDEEFAERLADQVLEGLASSRSTSPRPGR